MIDIDQERQFLRHSVATLAYRGARALHGAPAQFSDFPAGGKVRTAGQILAHVGDVLDWALALAQGQKRWQNSPPLAWEQETARFFSALKAFDDWLASGKELQASPERLFQGPIADALTRVGQIAMLRRLAGHPIKGENYFIAEIASGCVGEEQAAARKQFD